MEYVRILHLAATTMGVGGGRGAWNAARVGDCSSLPVPELKLPSVVDLGLYDRLLAGRCSMTVDTHARSAVAERVRECQ